MMKFLNSGSINKKLTLLVVFAVPAKRLPHSVYQCKPKLEILVINRLQKFHFPIVQEGVIGLFLCVESF